MIEATPSEQVAEILNLVGITQIFYIDDDFDNQSNNAQFKEMIITARSQDPNLFKCLVNITPDLEDLDDGEIEPFLYSIFNESPEKFDKLKELLPSSNDNFEDGGILKLLERHNLTKLSPAEWEKQFSEITQTASNALFLFDYKFATQLSEVRNGMIFLAHSLKELEKFGKSKNVACGLISNDFKPEEEQSRWDELAHKYEVKKYKFAVISKEYDENNTSNLKSFKRIALNRFVHDLIDKASTNLKEALSTAIDNLKDLDVYELEEGVFHSSNEEGVWEFDTLLRILGIYQRQTLLQKIIENQSEIQIVAENLRKVSQLSILANSKSATSGVIKSLRKWELYDEAEYLNKYHAPLELGDIFSIEFIKLNDKNEEEKYKEEYILLNQNCDLMVRNNGIRKIDFGILCKLGPYIKKQTEPLLHFQLKDYPEDKNTVRFSSSLMVNLHILDLCIFDENGFASLDVNQTDSPAKLMYSWKNRYPLVRAKFEESMKAYLIAQNSGNDFLSERKHSFIPTIQNAKFPTINAENNMIEYGIKRVRRVLKPISNSILSRYALSTARDALDHDFSKK